MRGIKLKDIFNSHNIPLSMKPAMDVLREGWQSGLQLLRKGTILVSMLGISSKGKIMLPHVVQFVIS